MGSNMNVAAGYGCSRSSQTELTRRLDGVGSTPEQADAWRFEGQGLCCCRLSALTTCLIPPMQVLRRPARSDAIYHDCFLFVLAGVFRKDTCFYLCFPSCSVHGVDHDSDQLGPHRPSADLSGLPFPSLSSRMTENDKVMQCWYGQSSSPA